MSKLRALAGILNFFIPAEVLSAVLLVFTMENVLDFLFSEFVPKSLQGAGWILIYLIGVVFISALNYTTANDEEIEDFNDDLDDF